KIQVVHVLGGVDTYRYVHYNNRDFMNVLNTNTSRIDPIATNSDTWISVRSLRGRIRGFGENAELNVESADRLVQVAAADGVRLVE
ncbi:MAG: hypothetical protein VCA35_07415, partial [Roseibacillus sp.]